MRSGGIYRDVGRDRRKWPDRPQLGAFVKTPSYAEVLGGQRWGVTCVLPLAKPRTRGSMPRQGGTLLDRGLEALVGIDLGLQLVQQR